jgi:uncharacterized cysteine cluster protein YcgN (CxxCxxCC family)
MTEVDWESLCTRCGKCCMVSKDTPCQHLTVLANGTTSCKIYKTRLGTKIGSDIECGEIREADYVPQECAYRKFFPSRPTEQ